MPLNKIRQSRMVAYSKPILVDPKPSAIRAMDFVAVKVLVRQEFGIHVQARLEEAAQCLLVIIGATPEGKKKLVGLIDGVRESAQSWKELLLDLKRRGLAMGTELAVADGTLGFWQAVEEVWPATEQCAPKDVSRTRPRSP